MTNLTGSSIQLNDLQGDISNGNVALISVSISAPLLGSLSIYGLSTGNATPNVSGQTPWVIPAASAGVFQHPGNGHSGGNARLYYVLSNSGDLGKAVVFTNFR